MFERSIILLLEHNQEGAMGFIVSLQTEMPIGELLPMAKGRAERAWLGGPVEPQVGWCLYDRPTGDPSEIRLAPNLCVSSSLEVLEQVLGTDGRFMLLLGYAGWGAGQLEEETHIGSWVFLEAGPELLLDVAPEDRWDHAWKVLGVDPSRLALGGAQA
jgi:putative transcriptional regulator